MPSGIARRGKSRLLDGVFTAASPNLSSQIDLPSLLELLATWNPIGSCVMDKLLRVKIGVDMMTYCSNNSARLTENETPLFIECHYQSS